MYTAKFGRPRDTNVSKDTETKTTTETNPNKRKQQRWQLRKASIQEVGPWSRPAGRPRGFPDVVVDGVARLAYQLVVRLVAARRRRWKGTPHPQPTGLTGFRLCRGVGGDRRRTSTKDRVVDEGFQRLLHPLRQRHFDEATPGIFASTTTSRLF